MIEINKINFACKNKFWNCNLFGQTDIYFFEIHNSVLYIFSMNYYFIKIGNVASYPVIRGNFCSIPFLNLFHHMKLLEPHAAGQDAQNTSINLLFFWLTWTKLFDKHKLPCVCFTFLSLFYFLKYVIYMKQHMIWTKT